MMKLSSLAWLYWDPPREAFTLPYFDLAIMWYGILFALGFIIAYFLFIPIVRQVIPDRERSLSFIDRLVWFVVLGTIIGARLGHVFFYDWESYRANPIEILMIRKGGLASHGGAVGVIIAIGLFLYFNRKAFPEMSLFKLLDLIAIPTALVCFFIRLGNFFNQEIVGYESSLPWAIIFGHTAEGVSAVPRHPTQLYEAFAYLITFVILFSLWKKYGVALKTGTLCGLLFIFVFGSRFFIEFLKLPQSVHDTGVLNTGQYLSIPFVVIGIIMVLYKAPPLGAKPPVS